MPNDLDYKIVYTEANKRDHRNYCHCLRSMNLVLANYARCKISEFRPVSRANRPITPMTK